MLVAAGDLTVVSSCSRTQCISALINRRRLPGRLLYDQAAVDRAEQEDAQQQPGQHGHHGQEQPAQHGRLDGQQHRQRGMCTGGKWGLLERVVADSGLFPDAGSSSHGPRSQFASARLATRHKTPTEVAWRAHAAFSAASEPKAVKRPSDRSELGSLFYFFREYGVGRDVCSRLTRPRLGELGSGRAGLLGLVGLVGKVLLASPVLPRLQAVQVPPCPNLCDAIESF